MIKNAGESECSHTCSLEVKATAVTEEECALAKDSKKKKRIVETYLIGSDEVIPN